jgi:hypothetical protein
MDLQDGVSRQGSTPPVSESVPDINDYDDEVDRSVEELQADARRIFPYLFDKHS